MIIGKSLIRSCLSHKVVNFATGIAVEVKSRSCCYLLAPYIQNLGIKSLWKDAQRPSAIQFTMQYNCFDNALHAEVNSAQRSKEWEISVFPSSAWFWNIGTLFSIQWMGQGKCSCKVYKKDIALYCWMDDFPYIA